MQLRIKLVHASIPGVIEKAEIGQGGSSNFSTGARDIAKGKAAETREGPGDLRSAEQMSAANRLESEEEKYEAKPTPNQSRFFNYERHTLRLFLEAEYIDC